MFINGIITSTSSVPTFFCQCGSIYLFIYFSTLRAHEGHYIGGVKKNAIQLYNSTRSGTQSTLFMYHFSSCPFLCLNRSCMDSNKLVQSHGNVQGTNKTRVNDTCLT